MAKQSPTLKELPLKMVGSTVFGRYPKISQEQTWNMIISDGWMVPYAGYKSVATLDTSSTGRGIFNSIRGSILVVVIGSGVFSYNQSGLSQLVGRLKTSTGDVFIAENDAQQVAICDRKFIYIYNYNSGSFTIVNIPITDFTPGYIEFQDGYFIASAIGKNEWRLSAPNDGTQWPAGSQNVGAFQTKSDNVQACVRFPGRGNQLFVFGSSVVEPWADVGYQLFPYQRSTGYNIDYGCASPTTIASGDTFVVWLGQNEKSGLAIMYSTGGDVKQISNDGINFRLSSVNNPSLAYGFLFKQDGHLFYQLSFPDPKDDFSLLYDFNTEKFFNVSDERTGCHIAKRVAFYNGNYYFVSFNDGNLYEMNSSIYTFNGNQIPRMRICQSIRAEDQMQFIVNELNFTIEQGEDQNLNRVDLSISRNGNNFGNTTGIYLNQIPNRRNIMRFRALGIANDFTPQFKFWGNGRFVFTDGVARIYQ